VAKARRRSVEPMINEYIAKRDLLVDHCGTMRSRDPSLLLRDPSVYSCRIATGNVFTSALRSNVRGEENTASFYCCVVAVFTEELPMNSVSKSLTIQ
jgi:hypothetical protein